MPALGDDESTVIGTVRQEVDETLEATKTWPIRVLILFDSFSKAFRGPEADVPDEATAVLRGLPGPFGFLESSVMIYRRQHEIHLLGERDVDRVKGHNQIFCAVDLRLLSAEGEFRWP